MNILVIAPHADDEILGVGGTMAKYIDEGSNVYVCVVTRPKEPVFKDELLDIIRNETASAHGYLSVSDTYYLDFPAVMLETVPRYELNAAILNIVERVRPDTVYIPHFGDMQRDHQLVAEAAMVALRPRGQHPVKKVLAYETLSETEWNIPHAANAFIPNVYYDISEFMEQKIKAMAYYQSQLGEFPNPRSADAIRALAKYRGSTIHVQAAEAFMLVREIQ